MKKILSFLFGLLIVCSTLASVSAMNVGNNKDIAVQKVDIEVVKNTPTDQIVKVNGNIIKYHTDGKVATNTSIELENKKEIKKINKELNEITIKLKEIESKYPKNKRILQYKKKLINLLNKRHELKLKNPKYKKELEYINGKEHQKMLWEIEVYNKKMMEIYGVPKIYKNIEDVKKSKISYIYENNNKNIDRIYDNTDSIYVQTKDELCFYVDDAEYVGYGAWVKLNNGEVYAFVWDGEYKEPKIACNWILDYLRNKYNIYPKEINYIHLKYFMQGKASLVYSYKYGKLISLIPATSPTCPFPGDKTIELWSEATYYPNENKWRYVGYPNYYGGGVNLIKNNWIDASTGFPFYNEYPNYYLRWVGSWENYGGFFLGSNLLHQQLVIG